MKNLSDFSILCWDNLYWKQTGVFLRGQIKLLKGAKKACFTACHLGKLLLACTSPNVIFICLDLVLFLISQTDYISPVIQIPQKPSLSRAGQNSLA